MPILVDCLSEARLDTSLAADKTVSKSFGKFRFSLRKFAFASYVILLASLPEALFGASKVYVANQGSNSVSVIDTSLDAVVEIPVGGWPAMITPSLDGAKIYITNQQTDNVSVIDTETSTVIATIDVGDNPQYGAAIPGSAKLYLLNGGSNPSVSVIDTDTDLVIEEIDGLGSQPRYIVAASRGHRRVSSCSLRSPK